MFEVDVKNLTHLCKKHVGVKEGRSEGGDQARFFYVDGKFQKRRHWTMKKSDNKTRKGSDWG